MRLLFALLAVILCAAFGNQVNAATVTFVENESSPATTLSRNNTAPTMLGTFGVGVSTVSGRVANARTSSRTSDFFSFEIADGTQLDSMYITNAAAATSISFIGMSVGNSFPYLSINDFDTINNNYAAIGAMTFGDVSPMFPLLLFDSSLPPASPTTNSNRPFFDLAEQNGAPTGVIQIPLVGPQTYTVFAQEWNTLTTYTVAFSVSAIPEPSSFAVLGLASVGAVMRRRRRA